jgi:hypothetical protein
MPFSGLDRYCSTAYEALFYAIQTSELLDAIEARGMYRLAKIESLKRS